MVEAIHPVVQENVGHVSMELSSGRVGVLRIETPAGQSSRVALRPRNH
jgi:hypothetical protein